MAPPDSVPQPDTSAKKPRLIFDGDCSFCRLWVNRWKKAVGHRVEFVPFQEQPPEVPPEEASQRAHFVTPDGQVYKGGEAVLRALAEAPRKRWMLMLYRFVPGWAWLTETAYGFLSKNRSKASRLTSWTVGPNLEPPTYYRARWLFLRALALVLIFAFLSTAVQSKGLVGADGITPMVDQMAYVESEYGGPSLTRYPTLSWMNRSDSFLVGQAWAGVFFAFLLLIGLAPMLSLIACWVLWLSVNTVHGDFLFQVGDIIVLEVTLIAIFFAPRTLRPGLAREAPPSRLAHFLLKWALFRLMILCGVTKILSHDASWADMSALFYHYYTQPNPGYLSYFVSQAPAFVHELSVFVTLVIELVLPFFIFGPRRLKMFAGVSFAVLQVMIWSTGIFGWFNLISLTLGILLFDDVSLKRIVPAGLAGSPPDEKGLRPSFVGRVRFAGMLLVTLFLFSLSTGLFLQRLIQKPEVNYTWPADEDSFDFVNRLRPFRPTGTLSPFARMHVDRKEIVLEGSDDGVTWKEYEFRWKPGSTDRPPRIYMPHMPRLDWHMWFLANENPEPQPWYGKFLEKVLQGSPDVLALLEENPFPDKPPKLLRSSFYHYQYTELEEFERTGNYWKRQKQGPYIQDVTLREGKIALAH